MAVTPTVLYIYPASGYDGYAARFVEGMVTHDAGAAYRLVVVTNGWRVNSAARMLFSPLTVAEWYEHDNTGWDIGAYIAYARRQPAGQWLCPMGASAYVKREGWLRRLMHVAEGHGAGIYGSMGTVHMRPHIRTTGFVCPAGLLARYDAPVTNRAQRYEFEHGMRSLTQRTMKANLPALMVTWDGVYTSNLWGMVPNGYWRGDQSALLTYDAHSDLHENK